MRVEYFRRVTPLACRVFISRTVVLMSRIRVDLIQTAIKAAGGVDTIRRAMAAHSGHADVTAQAKRALANLQ